MSAMAGTGSTAVTPVVPTVGTTASGRMPAARSRAMAVSSAPGSMRNASSVPTRTTLSRPSPSVMTALSTLEWASSEQ